MKKALTMILLTLFLLNSSRYVFPEEMPKEGSYTNKNFVTGTAKTLPMGEGRIQLNYEGTGIFAGDAEEGFVTNASVLI